MQIPADTDLDSFLHYCMHNPSDILSIDPQLYTSARARKLAKLVEHYNQQGALLVATKNVLSGSAPAWIMAKIVKHAKENVWDAQSSYVSRGPELIIHRVYVVG